MGLRSPIHLDLLLSQCRTLDLKQMTSWTGVPRLLVVLVSNILIAVAWYVLWFEPEWGHLEQAKQQESQTKANLGSQFKKAASLPLLRERSSQAKQILAQLEPLLPGDEQIPQLLSRVNQMGYQRDLKFELFQPETAVPKGDFDVIPVKVSMKGNYMDIAGFVRDVASQDRLMMFDEFRLSVLNTGEVGMEGWLMTFRQSLKLPSPGVKQ